MFPFRGAAEKSPPTSPDPYPDPAASSSPMLSVGAISMFTHGMQKATHFSASGPAHPALRVLPMTTVRWYTQSTFPKTLQA